MNNNKDIASLKAEYWNLGSANGIEKGLQEAVFVTENVHNSLMWTEPQLQAIRQVHKALVSKLGEIKAENREKHEQTIRSRPPDQ